MPSVITGIGVVSPLGCGRANFWNALLAGTSGITPIECIDVSEYSSKLGGEIKNFDPLQFVELKSFRYLNRGTKFLAAAVQLALDDAGLQAGDELGNNTGIIIGSALANYPQTTDYTVATLQRGPQALTPMESFDVALNASTNYISVQYRLKPFARTIASGFSSGIEAVTDAARAIEHRLAGRVITGGLEQLSYDSYLTLYWLGLLAGSALRNSDGGLRIEERGGPFDRRRSGFVLGEGAYVTIVEEASVAAARGASVYAEVAGYNSLSLGNPRFDEETKIGKAGKVMRQAINASRLEPNDIELVVASANGAPELDRIEAQAICRLLGDVAVTAPKALAGECYGAGGALLATVAALAISDGTSPGSPTTTEIDPDCPVALVRQTRQFPDGIKAVLVNALDPFGNVSSMVLRRPVC